MDGDGKNNNEYRDKAIAALEKRIVGATEYLADSTPKNENKPGACIFDSELAATLAAEDSDVNGDSIRETISRVNGMNRTIRKDVPVHSGHRLRMRESAKRDVDLDGFSEIELIEYLLSFFIPQKDTNVTAHKLIDKFGSAFGVLRATEGELVSIPNITKQAIELLPRLLYICIDSCCADIRISDRRSAAEFFMSMFLGSETYGIYVAYLGGNFKLISIELLDEKRLTPRTVVTTALSVGAKYVLIARRDSGFFPNSFGISEFVAKLNTGLFAIGVKLLDYMMFTDHGYYTVGKPPRGCEWTPMYVFVPVQSFADAPCLLKAAAEENTVSDETSYGDFYAQLKRVADKSFGNKSHALDKK